MDQFAPNEIRVRFKADISRPIAAAGPARMFVKSDFARLSALTSIDWE